jgi:hypothetical protein
MATITPEQRQEIEQTGLPIRLEDTQTHEVYVLIKADTYEQLQGLVGPLSVAEQKAVLRHAGEKAGWDDPALDVYNDL